MKEKLKKINEYNNLLVVNPTLAQEWNYEKNGSLTPEHVAAHGNQNVWWKCKEKGHEYLAQPNNRSNGKGCPYCANQKICIDNCLETLNPAVAKSWHPTKNGKLTPRDVGVGASKKSWWKCFACNSDWEAKIADRNLGRGCPYCSGHSINEKTCLATKNPKLSKEWDFEKNKDLTPDKVTSRNPRKVWWECDKKHSWEATIADRVGSKNVKGTNCPFCCNKKIDDNNCLSITNPKLTKEWNYKKNNSITPDNIGANNYKKVWWLCPSCKYEWMARIVDRNHGVYKCKRCNSVATKFPELIKEWDFEKNKIDPFFTAYGANIFAYWKCKNNHCWRTKVSARTSRERATNCPDCFRVTLTDGTVCASYIEAFFYLKYRLDGLAFEHNKRYGTGLGKRRYDFYFPTINKYVEVTCSKKSWLGNGLDKRAKARWDKYIKNINKKKRFVENKLKGEFEFIHVNLTPKQMKLVRENIVCDKNKRRK